VVLAVLVALSGLARVIDLGRPCAAPCRSGSSHLLIFDESYYVNAARVIDHIHPPVGAPYHSAPLGKDPNAEHPQLAKLVIAAGIELLGDNPWGWRIGSVLFGLAAIVALYVLVRAGRGGRWLAVGAAAVMAADNLALVHGRIATLDIYAVCLMLVAATLYVRAHPLAAGVVLGLGGAMKLVALYLVIVLVIFEAFRWLRSRRVEHARAGPRWRGAIALALFIAATAMTLLLALWVLDLLVPAYDTGTGITYAGNPFSHLSHMTNYALSLHSMPGATGASSSPWQWLLNEKAFDYARVAVNSFSNGTIVATRSLIRFQGAVNPFIILLAVPALFVGVATAWRNNDDVSALAASWVVGTFGVFVVQADLLHRVSYIYYLLIVLPGVYILLAQWFSSERMPLAATMGWAVVLLFGFAHLYPIRSF
jgi:dolichyl-phosphate-mannose-protein mannosyltransferase